MEKFSEEALTCLHFDWEGNVGSQMLISMLQHRGKVRLRTIKSSDLEDLDEAIHSPKFRVGNYVFEAISLYQYFCLDSDNFVKCCLDEEMTESIAVTACGLIHMFGRAESLSAFNRGSWYMALHDLELLSSGQEMYFFVMYYLIKNYDKYEQGLSLSEQGGDGVLMSNYKLYSILHASDELLGETIADYLQQMKKVKTMCVQLLENKMVAKAFLELANSYATLKGKESLAHYFSQFVGYPEDSLGMVGEELAKQTLKG